MNDEPTRVPAEDFVALLRCPETGQSLRIAPSEILARAGLAAGLLRDDGRVVYPILDGIPVLLVGDAVPLSSA